MIKFANIFKQSKLLNVVFLSNIFLSFHYYLIVYVNSSFLENFFSETQMSSLYIISAIINTILLLNAPKILNKIGNYKSAMLVLIIDILAIGGMATLNNHFYIGLCFVLHEITLLFFLFNMDVFLEGATKNENQTGDIRGMYMTLGNIVLVISPTIVAFLLTNNKYWLIYTVSLIFLIPLLYLINKYFKKIEHRHREHIKIKETLREYLKNKNLYNIFSAGFLLQLFYAFMVVYTPIYLQKYIGFGWEEIGIMFTIMLLPFILFELPVGDMADKKYGEKEFMTLGLVIMGLSTIFMSFVTIKSFWIWAIILFSTRVGASITEISSESYFFKKVNQEKTNIISFYRLTRPLSYIIAPIIAFIALQFIHFQYIFIIIGVLMIIGTKYSLSLVDTK